MIVFESAFDQQTHIALVRGNIEDGEDVLVRVQTHCLTGHVFGSPACHCHEQMDRAMEMIANAGRGVLLYLYEMGRSRSGAALLEYHGKHGFDSNETIGLRGEQREYGIGAQILAALNIRSMRILTNHPRKLVALEAAQTARAGERGKSAAKGADFEDLLELMLGDIARGANDLLERCGTDAGDAAGRHLERLDLLR